MKFKRARPLQFVTCKDVLAVLSATVSYAFGTEFAKRIADALSRTIGFLLVTVKSRQRE